jgi:hypothetical protein
MSGQEITLASTRHLSRRDRTLLSVCATLRLKRKTPAWFPAVIRKDDGFWIQAGRGLRLELVGRARFGEPLAELWRRAAGQGFGWLCLDPDGPCVKGVGIPATCEGGQADQH